MPRVIKTEEKGSDVNLAVHLLNDGYKNEYEVAALITNDSDLAEAVRVVRQELSLPVGVVNPVRASEPSIALRNNATFVKQISQRVLENSQFADSLEDDQGTFHKPSTW